MKMPLLLASAFVLCAAATGCATTASESTGSTEDDLRKVDCPPNIELSLDKPDVATDDAIKGAMKRMLVSQGSTDAQAETEAQAQMSELAEWLTTARAESAYKVKGAVTNACNYVITDARTGAASPLRVWFQKQTMRGVTTYQMRMSLPVELPHTDASLYMTVPVTALSPTTLTIDATKKGTLYGEKTEPGHDGPEGWSYWMGSVKATANVAP